MKRNRLTLSIWIALLFIIAVICLGVGCAIENGGEPQEREKYTIEYRVDSQCGRINGVVYQRIYKGEDAHAVEAEAKEGYKFVGWSDGVKSAWRQDKDIQGDMTVYAEFEKEKYEVRYTAGEGGRIEGESEQKVAYREDGEPVTAVAEFGYMFVKWSDGNESAERQDTWIMEPLEVAAEFARIEKTYQYNYNYATGGDEEKEVKIHIDHMDAAEFPVPVKEHSIFGGWYADKERTIAVTDAKGNRVIGQELFSVQTDTLYAKWTAEEEVNYKLLLVFVTEIDAHGSTRDDKSLIDIYHKLSEEEMKICELIPQKLKKKLNEIFYGLVNFEIDTYFTKEPVRNWEFRGQQGDLYINEYLMEMETLRNQYRCVLYTHNMNDYGEKYHSLNLQGRAGASYGQIYMDSFLYGISNERLPIEVMWDTSYEKHEELWDRFLETYLHEFCHTIEMDQGQMGIPAYHSVLETSHEVKKTTMKLTEEYLLNFAQYNEELVGIPYDYWTGRNVQIEASYSSAYCQINGNMYQIIYDGGDIYSKNEQYTVLDDGVNITQEVPYGGEADTITAVARPGYRFVKWSDGVTTETRRDADLTARLSVNAIFESIE